MQTRLRRILGSVALMLALLLPATALAADYGLLQVVGEARAEVLPDRAEIRLGITALEETAAAARDKAAVVLGGVLESVTQMGIAQDRVRTVSYRIYPEYEYVEVIDEWLPGTRAKTERVLVGYRVSATVAVTVDDLDLAGKVVDTAIAAGANQVEDIRFLLQDERQHTRRLLLEAVDDARVQATAIADRLGVRITGVETISIGSIPRLPVARMESDYAVAVPSAATVVAPGTLNLSAQVHIAFRVEAGEAFLAD